jgi:hypothetical protein
VNSMVMWGFWVIGMTPTFGVRPAGNAQRAGTSLAFPASRYEAVPGLVLTAVDAERDVYLGVQVQPWRMVDRAVERAALVLRKILPEAVDAALDSEV